MRFPIPQETLEKFDELAEVAVSLLTKRVGLAVNAREISETLNIIYVDVYSRSIKEELKFFVEEEFRDKGKQLVRETTMGVVNKLLNLE